VTAPDTLRTPGPFTITWLRETIKTICGNRYGIPSEASLEPVVEKLNAFDMVWKNREAARAAQARSADVTRALQTLKQWHTDRKKEAAGVPSEIFESEIFERERQLQEKFDAYAAVMASRVPSPLPMDALLWVPSLQSWRDLAHNIAYLFDLAMDRKFGRSDYGPTARFTAAAVEKITGKSLAPKQVALYLRKSYRRKRSRAGFEVINIEGGRRLWAVKGTAGRYFSPWLPIRRRPRDL
jgi:hypothetical protein